MLVCSLCSLFFSLFVHGQSTVAPLTHVNYLYHHSRQFPSNTAIKVSHPLALHCNFTDFSEFFFFFFLFYFVFSFFLLIIFFYVICSVLLDFFDLFVF